MMMMMKVLLVLLSLAASRLVAVAGQTEPSWPASGSVLASGSSFRFGEIVDVDRDGDRDVLYCSQSSPAIVEWRENTDGSGTLGAAKTITTAVNQCFAIKLYDFTGNNLNDAVIAARGDSEVVLMKQTAADTWTKTSVGSHAQVMMVDIGDVNDDGDMDIVSIGWTSSKLKLWTNNGDATSWTEVTVSSTINTGAHVMFVDLNGDGDLDILAGVHGSSAVQYWFGNGDETFGSKTSLPVGCGGARAVDAADVNGDGLVDVVAACKDGGHVAVWIGQTSTSWADKVTLTVTQPRSVKLVDMDLDGDLDFLASSITDDEIVYWYNNLEALGTYSAKQTVHAGPELTGVRWADAADLDGDTLPDVLGAAQSSAHMIVYINGATDPAGGGSTVESNPAASSAACTTAGYGFYKDGDDGTNDCTCNQPSELLDTNAAIAPITLDTAGSKLENDVLTIKWVEPVKYYYVNGFDAPDINVPNVLNGNGAGCVDAQWTFSYEANDDCTRTWTASIPWTSAYQSTGNDGCGFTRVQDDDYISLRLDLSLTTREDLPELDAEEGSQRDDANHAKVRQVLHKLPFSVRFPRQATATTSDLVVFSPIRTLTSVVQQEVVGDPVGGSTGLTGKITVYTDVQWPFKLTTPLYDSEAVDGVSFSGDFSFVSGDCKTGDGIDTPAACDVNAWQDGLEDANCPPCSGNWLMQLVTDNDGTCYYDGTYNVKWTVECHDTEPAASACPLSSTPGDHTVQLAITVQSSNLCPQVIDTVAFTATLKTYEDAPGGVAKDDFLNQQRVYFEGEFSTDDVSITKTKIVQIELLRPNRAAKNDEVLYQCNADRSVCEPTNPIGLAFDIQNVAEGVVTPSPGAVSKPSFDVLVDTVNSVLSLSDDEREIVQFKVTVDVTYQNAGQQKQHEMTLSSASVVQSRPLNSQDTVARATLGVSSVSFSTSSTLFGFSMAQVGLASAGVGFLGAVIIAGVLRHKARRRQRLTKLQVEMTVGHSSV